MHAGHYDASKQFGRQAGTGMTIEVGLSLSILTGALGVFVTASPARAAKIFASGRLEKLPPRERALFLRWYRAFGIILCLSGLLFALDWLGYWK
jgi:hypothetical protein